MSRQIKKKTIPEMPTIEKTFKRYILRAMASGNYKAAIRTTIATSLVYQLFSTYSFVIKSSKIFLMDSLKIVSSAVPIWDR